MVWVLMLLMFFAISFLQFLHTVKSLHVLPYSFLPFHYPPTSPFFHLPSPSGSTLPFQMRTFISPGPSVANSGSMEPYFFLNTNWFHTQILRVYITDPPPAPLYTSVSLFPYISICVSPVFPTGSLLTCTCTHVYVYTRTHTPLSPARGVWQLNGQGSNEN